MSITILDENDNSPEFDITSDTSVSIPEDTPLGRKVAVVLGRDRDAGLNGLVSIEDKHSVRTWGRKQFLKTNGNETNNLL